MHILHVITTMNPADGGPSQGIKNLDKAMREMGVVREVMCMDAPGSTYLDNNGFKIHVVGPAGGWWHYSSELIPWLTENISRFDVVIINGLWLYHSYATWKVIRKLKKAAPDKKLPRVLVMPHGMLDPYFQLAKERRLKAIRNWIYWKLIESKVVNDADGLLFTCETEMLLARETFTPYHPKNEYNIGYGIEAPPAYDPAMSAAFNAHCPDLHGTPYLLFLSRIHPKKGVDLLLKAYIDLYKSRKPADAKLPKLVIAGPGLDSHFGKKLRDEVNKFPEIKANIFFPGMLTGDAKWGAFYGCEAFVLPSHQENFGIAVAEALACYKPVLISDQVNIWREIKNGGFVSPDTFEGTRSIIEKWLNLSVIDKKQMAQNAWNVYHENFQNVPAALKFFKALSIIEEN